MNAGDQVSRQLRQVRRLLMRLAEPHPAVRFITNDVETHVALLDPKLAVLDPAPFNGLNTSHQKSVTGQPPVRRSPSRTSTVPKPSAEPRRRSEFAHPAAPSVRSQQIGERLTASSASEAPRVSEAMRPVERLTEQGALPAGSPPARRHERQAPSANVLGLNAHAERADVAAHESLPRAANSEQPDNVDLDALVQRVLRRRRSRQSARHSARGAERSVSLTEAPSERAHAARVTPTLEVTTAAVAQRPVLPVLPRRTHAATAALQTSRPDHESIARQSDSLTPLIQVRTPPPMTPSSSPVHGGHTAFIFDPFEPREPVDIGEHTLTDRIDQALREQARRQGVDLT